VGLPLALSFAEAGERVIGVETDARRAARLRRGDSYVPDVPSACLRAMHHCVEVTTQSAALAAVDAIVICVPTPVTPDGEPDLSALVAAGRMVAGILRRGQIVVLESTVGPGTTREGLMPILEESGLVAGRDFNLAFSPQRLDPGRLDFTLRTTPKLVSGLTEACADRAEALYDLVCNRVVRLSTPEAAELANLLESMFRAVNVALVNELAVLADRMDVDIWEVVDASATKPFGFMAFEPGPGTGGNCLGVDPFHLVTSARKHGVTTELVEVTGRSNRRTPYTCIERVERALGELDMPVRGARVAIIGMSYKAGVGDTHDSAGPKIAAWLAQGGAIVSYHDPYVDELPALGLRSRSLADLESGCDLAVIVTAHPNIDYRALAERTPVVDLRDATRRTRPQSRALRPVPSAKAA
jgi:UDP-N-acetyl-D-glucosamine dehydrogenase